MKLRYLALIASALSACAADPDPDAPDARDARTASGGEPGDARLVSADAVADATVDASIPEPDADPRPNCVAPVDGACPEDVEGVVEGFVWDPDARCWRAEIISCLYNVGGSPGEATSCRVSDGVPFWVPWITCRPFVSRQCTPDELSATTREQCNDQ
jgi:hypothetical protein